MMKKGKFNFLGGPSLAWEIFLIYGIVKLKSFKGKIK